LALLGQQLLQTGQLRRAAAGLTCLAAVKPAVAGVRQMSPRNAAPAGFFLWQGGRRQGETPMFRTWA